MANTTNQVNNRPTAKTGDRRRRHFSSGEDQRDYDFEVLEVARVVRVVKGGRRFSFRTSVVVGNKSGKVGLGIGKSKDVQSSINKAYDRGVKQLKDIALADNTIPYEVRAKSGGSQVMLRPARLGTGLIAGGIVRLVAQMAGIRDVVSKRLGSANKVNTARATIEALSSLKIRK